MLVVFAVVSAKYISASRKLLLRSREFHFATSYYLLIGLNERQTFLVYFSRVNKSARQLPGCYGKVTDEYLC